MATQQIKNKGITVKDMKYIKARVEGKSKREAGLAAGAKTPKAADKYAERASKKVEIQKAIDDALEAQNLTPEMLVEELKSVIVQNKEIGAKRLAIKDGFELMGWRKDERPQATLSINNAFFSNIVDSNKQVGSNSEDVIDV